jgi:uncharacterized membrane protein YdbT with pleckstrin-like domain
MFGEMGAETVSADPPDTVKGAKTSAPSSAPRRRGPVDVAEETLWEGTFSPKAMLGVEVGAGFASLVLLVLAFLYASGVWFWLLLGAIVVLWLAVAARYAVRRLGIHYKLTNQMFYHRRGVLTRVTDRIELIEIHDVTYTQGIFDRMVNVGRIRIDSNDRTHPHFYLIGVEDVDTVVQLIDKARRAEQVRRGRRIDFSNIDGET